MQKVIIIGAGPAGLTAAYELASSDGEYSIIVLEESQEFGGISRTVRHNGNRMDIGGHRFFSKDERVVEWWEKFMPMQGAPSMGRPYSRAQSAFESRRPRSGNHRRSHAHAQARLAHLLPQEVF